jgi:phosphomannomutase/phosphoglucomutase
MVGSPVVARVMMENNAIFGGEENGGLIFPEMQHCRDSAMTIAKILEILSYENRELSDLVGEIPNYETYKIKIKCPNEKKGELIDILSEKISNESGILKIDKTDGLKLYVSDGWVIMRPSGTEPVFRVFSESKDKIRSKELAEYYKNMAQDIINNIS